MAFITAYRGRHGPKERGPPFYPPSGRLRLAQPGRTRRHASGGGSRREEDEDKYSVEGERRIGVALQLYSPTSTATTLLDTDESATGIVKRRRESLLSATLQEGKGRERESERANPAETLAKEERRDRPQTDKTSREEEAEANQGMPRPWGEEKGQGWDAG
ncbi:hypothetical protein TEQG_01080 [Trichophyton equinum CBS 127.97]|uniref:Uncharacterized protein n=1 Tax=Trichophyton equinum (strain ATCC MYA-4606 / CBS 127.97) TaxID=559882 RepID=F2PJH3_TRIEC|nr:hypothetical protein TEQG_01080 [Trichophyton equinum CBS 127.97]